MSGSLKYYYTVYNQKDEVIAAGTAEECAEMMGMARKSFFSTVSRCEKGINKKYTIVKEVVRRLYRIKVIETGEVLEGTADECAEKLGINRNNMYRIVGKNVYYRKGRYDIQYIGDSYDFDEEE